LGCDGIALAFALAATATAALGLTLAMRHPLSVFILLIPATTEVFSAGVMLLGGFGHTLFCTHASASSYVWRPTGRDNPGTAAAVSGQPSGSRASVGPVSSLYWYPNPEVKREPLRLRPIHSPNSFKIDYGIKSRSLTLACHKILALARYHQPGLEPQANEQLLKNENGTHTE
jgi:hypothetical protein